MLKVNHLNGFGQRSEKFSVQIGSSHMDNDSAAGNTQIYNNVYLGPQYRDRYIVLACAWRSGLNPTAVRINGVTATLGILRANTATSPDLRSAIYYARVRSGVFVNVEIDWSLATNLSFRVFRVVNYGNGNMARDTADGADTATINLTIDRIAGGAVIYALSQNSGVGLTFSPVDAGTTESRSDSPGGEWTMVTGLHTPTSSANNAAISAAGTAAKAWAVLSISPPT